MLFEYPCLSRRKIQRVFEWENSVIEQGEQIEGKLTAKS